MVELLYELEINSAEQGGRVENASALLPSMRVTVRNCARPCQSVVTPSRLHDLFYPLSASQS
jgi:hypothetical protein